MMRPAGCRQLIDGRWLATERMPVVAPGHALSGHWSFHSAGIDFLREAGKRKEAVEAGAMHNKPLCCAVGRFPNCANLFGAPRPARPIGAQAAGGDRFSGKQIMPSHTVEQSLKTTEAMVGLLAPSDGRMCRF